MVAVVLWLVALIVDKSHPLRQMVLGDEGSLFPVPKYGKI